MLNLSKYLVLTQLQSTRHWMDFWRMRFIRSTLFYVSTTYVSYDLIWSMSASCTKCRVFHRCEIWSAHGGAVNSCIGLHNFHTRKVCRRRKVSVWFFFRSPMMFLKIMIQKLDQTEFKIGAITKFLLNVIKAGTL